MKCAKCNHTLNNHYHTGTPGTYGSTPGFCWHCPCEGGRDTYPALRSVVTSAGGGNAVDAMKNMRDRAEAEGSPDTARIYQRLLDSLAIPESDLVQ